MPLPLPFTEIGSTSPVFSARVDRLCVHGPAADRLARALVMHWNAVGLRVGVIGADLAEDGLGGARTRQAHGRIEVMAAVDDLDERGLDALVTFGPLDPSHDGRGPVYDALQRYSHSCGIPWMAVGERNLRWCTDSELFAHEQGRSGVIHYDADARWREHAFVRIDEQGWTVDRCESVASMRPLATLLHAERALSEQTRR